MIGIGVDLVEVERIRAALARTPGIELRLFTGQERAYCRLRRDPAERFAVRFAAKEAVMKALGVGLGAFAFQDVEVVKSTSGAPALRLRGAAAELARTTGVTGWRLTLSHTANLAEAIAVAL